MLSQEGSSEYGQWDTSRAEYQREPMDAFTDPTVHTIVLEWASQLGKSEILLNCIAYSVHIDPSPMLMVQPDKDNAKDFSEDRIDTMIRDTDVLSRKIYPSRGGGHEKQSGTFKKNFAGGYLAIASANVPASLAGKPIKRLFEDECDRYEKSSKKEGDPIDLAEKRTTNFWDKKIIKTSSPGNDTDSKIHPSYQRSDQREYFVPCPHCDQYQKLEWKNVCWDKEIVDGVKVHRPETAHMVCIECGTLLFESDKPDMVARGKWIAQAEFNGVAGFRLNTLYSPWFTWAQFVQEFLDAKEDVQKLKVFTNTRLCETWKEEGAGIESSDLYHRREKYTAEVPMGAFVLTAGVDIQNDRIEILVNGWGLREECWSVDHQTFWGDPEQPGVWRELQDYLDRTFAHESGVKLRISSTCIDSGFKTQIVYDFCKGKTAQRIFATKGVAGDGRPIITSPAPKRTGVDERKVELFTVGVDPAKEIIYGRLNRTEPGPGYIHFPDRYMEEFFKQLAAEQLVKKMERGVEKKAWRKIRARNEALDMMVLSFAGLNMLASNWQEWGTRIIPHQHHEGLKPDTPEPPAPARKKNRIIGRMY